MDAQNAVEATSTKPAASSASSRLPDSERQKPSQSSSAASLTKSPTLSRAAPPSSRDTKSSSSKPPPAPAPTATAANSAKDSSKGSGATAASPSAARDAKAAASSSREKQDDDGGGTDGNSEAETIVLSKDGSPSKPRSRKVIKHEDKPNGVSASSAVPSEPAPTSRRHAADRKEGQPEKGEKGDKTSGDAAADGASSNSSTALPQQKKKRLHERLQPNSHQQAHPRVKDTSSSLSSAPASPPRSRNPSSRPHSGSDSDRGHRSKSPKRSISTASKDRLRPPEKLVPHKRKAPKVESDDEADGRKARRLRLASAGAGGDGTSHSSSRTGKDSARSSHSNTGNANGNGSSTKSSTSRSHREASQNRSLSPQPRAHRRSLSTHLPPQSNGLGLKKKRVPAPLQSTDYNSDESSASGSPHVRSSKLRGLNTPATADSAISPAKIGPHKKHLDAHGQTFLARACARGEYDLAQQRLQERPEDLNVADFAGNTPLQIAAINGYGEIVKFLIDAGCNLDCVNHDKDTPLLDAVDNGHLDVVKLLLDAGVNPRKANVNGEEPLDRVGDDIENSVEIRAALVEAKKKVGERRFTSEEHRHESDELRYLRDPDSPQRSPAPPGSNSRRAATVRATKTSNHLLYMPMDDKTLRLAAGRGDEQNVIRILQVREAFDDPESMVAASRGGHDVVLQLLLALGKANPDPPPISAAPPEHATPILAAIGQENIKIVNLLLEQTGFDPTKRFNGDTYYEVARKRQGPNWKEEEDILKKAYDSYKKAHSGKTKSPPRKDSESRKSARATDAPDEASSSRTLKQKLASPSQERPKKTTNGTKATPAATSTTTSPRDEKASHKRSSEHAASHGDGKASPKRASSASVPAAKPKQRGDRTSAAPNLDHDTPPPSKQISKSKKADSDSVTISSEGEAVKPRRKKLISGRELKDEKVREKEREREKQRRASMASTNTPTPPKDSSSPRDSRQDDAAPDKIRADKHRDRDRDRARQLKKEESKESTSGVAGEGAGKRHRLSETPPNVGSSDKDTSEGPIKRRRLDAENGTGKEKRPSKGSAPPDDASGKTAAAAVSRDTQGQPTTKTLQRRRDEEDRKTPSGLKTKKREASSDRGRKDSSKPSVAPLEKSIHVKSEDVDVEMADVSAEVRSSNNASALANAEAEALREKEEEKKKKAEAKAQLQAAEAKKKEEELQRRRQEEEDEKRKKEEKRKKDEEKRKRDEEEAKMKEEEEKKKRELEEKRKKEEEEKLKQRKKLEEEERRRKDEERKRKEEEEKKKREEEEKRRHEEEERKRKLEEEERKKREEEERLHQEQLEREAAEEARRKLEEEERKKRERIERGRLEQERILAEKEAEELRRRQLEEEERVRVAKLPPALRWLSLCSNPRLSNVARLFKTMQGVRYDCINTDASGSTEGREQWLLNTQVALILGDKDLGLSRYQSWPRLPVNMIAKRVIWRLESDRYSLTDPDLYDLGKQLPGYYGAQNPEDMGTLALEKLRLEAWEKFSSMDMFFIKVSDVMRAIASEPHLRDVRLSLVYRELPEKESQLMTFAPTLKWKNDPDADQLHGFAPGTKYYVNGALVGEHRPGMAVPSKTPPPEIRVPRRGLVAVPMDDPEFAPLCRNLSIDPFSFPGYTSLTTRLSPQLTSSKVNGKPPTAYSTGVNGNIGSGSARSAPLPGGQLSRPAVNGVNGVNGTKND